MMMPVVPSLKCDNNEYQAGFECCRRCPKGNHVDKNCTHSERRSCAPCDDGTYMDEPTGEPQCFVCRKCPSDLGLKVNTACSPVSNAVCESLDGFFCLIKEKDGSCRTAQKHKSCEPGQFILKLGSASEDTLCSLCPKGTFFNKTMYEDYIRIQFGTMGNLTVKAKNFSKRDEVPLPITGKKRTLSNKIVSPCQPHTQCKWPWKFTKIEGNSVSDAECGQSAVLSIIVISAAVLIPVIIVSVLFLCLKKKKVKQTEPTDVMNGIH